MVVPIIALTIGNVDIKQEQSISQPNLKMLMLSENVCFKHL